MSGRSRRICRSSKIRYTFRPEYVSGIFHDRPVFSGGIYRFYRNGSADVVFLPLPSAKKPALVVELKYDKTAVAAIQQIKDRNYTQALSDYTGEILLVGINYDKDCADKPHSCVIEKVKKD